VTLCIATFARLAFVDGNPEQAAVAPGAADGLRRRVGVREWPATRRGEAELIKQVEQAVGADRFEQAFSRGSRLNRREAAAIVRERGDEDDEKPGGVSARS
jgi:hypothetical protein